MLSQENHENTACCLSLLTISQIIYKITILELFTYGESGKRLTPEIIKNWCYLYHEKSVACFFSDIILIVK